VQWQAISNVYDSIDIVISISTALLIGVI